MYVGIYLHNLAWFDDEWLKSTNKITIMNLIQCDVVFGSRFVVPYLQKFSEI